MVKSYIIKGLPVIKSAKNDFCNECGAWFPPEDKPGQGICKEWQKCLERQKNESPSAVER